MDVTLYIWNKEYRRDIGEQNNIRFRPDAQGAEDWFFNMEYLQYCNRSAFVEKELYLFVITECSIMDTFRASRVVINYRKSMPRAWRYIAGIIQDTSAELTTYAQTKAAMFYQTILRKIESSDEVYIQKAVEYVRKHKRC